MKPLELFRRGFDYVEIANTLHISEAEVERLIHAARADERMKAYKADYAAQRKEHIRTYQREYQRRVRAANREALA